MKVMVPHQCVKIRSVGRPDDVKYGLVVVRTATREMKEPGVIQGHVYVLTAIQIHVTKRWTGRVAGLSYFLLAVLKLHVACEPNPHRRLELDNQVQAGTAYARCGRMLEDRLSFWRVDLRAGAGGRNVGIQQELPGRLQLWPHHGCAASG